MDSFGRERDFFRIIEAAAFVFLSGSAGAGLVAAGLFRVWLGTGVMRLYILGHIGHGFTVAGLGVGFGRRGRRGRLYIVGHGRHDFGVLVNGGGWAGIDVDLEDVKGDLLLLGRRRGGLLDDEHGGLEARRGRSFGVGEDVVKGLVCEIDQFLGFLAEEHGFVVLGMREGFAERQIIASPVGDSVTMDAGLGRCVFGICAA